LYLHRRGGLNSGADTKKKKRILGEHAQKRIPTGGARKREKVPVNYIVFIGGRKNFKQRKSEAGRRTDGRSLGIKNCRFFQKRKLASKMMQS